MEMSKERYAELDKVGEGLTEEELEAGWHFCPDWDGMLVGPGMQEAKVCTQLMLYVGDE
jgi:hypothetical protein